MGRIVKRGKYYYIQNTHNGVLGSRFLHRSDAEKHLRKLKRRFKSVH